MRFRLPARCPAASVRRREPPLLFGGDASGWQCSFCQGVCKRLGKSPACEKVHLYGAMQAERFGCGRYIYFCPCGLTWFASPILGEGRLSGILVGGPVLMMEEDDFFAHGLFLTAVSKPPVLASLKAALSTVTRYLRVGGAQPGQRLVPDVAGRRSVPERPLRRPAPEPGRSGSAAEDLRLHCLSEKAAQSGKDRLSRGKGAGAHRGHLPGRPGRWRANGLNEILGL